MDIINKNTGEKCTINKENINIGNIIDYTYKVSNPNKPYYERQFIFKCNFREYSRFIELFIDEIKLEASKNKVLFTGGVKENDESTHLEPIQIEKLYLPSIGNIEIQQI